MLRSITAATLAMVAYHVASAPAHAALEKYRLQRTLIHNNGGHGDLAPSCRVSPNTPGVANVRCRDAHPDGRVALIDSTGPAPVLRKLAYAEDWSASSSAGCPGGCYLTFQSLRAREGPGGPTTGTGATNSGASLRWGIATGWTSSGSFWCNSEVPIICNIVGGTDEATTDPPQTSSFYDLGTWSFHGTGFTGTPFTRAFHTLGSGNVQDWYRGSRVVDATVPALPLAGLIAAAASVAAALWRRRR